MSQVLIPGAVTVVAPPALPRALPQAPQASATPVPPLPLTPLTQAPTRRRGDAENGGEIRWDTWDYITCRSVDINSLGVFFSKHLVGMHFCLVKQWGMR